MENVRHGTVYEYNYTVRIVQWYHGIMIRYPAGTNNYSIGVQHYNYMYCTRVPVPGACTCTVPYTLGIARRFFGFAIIIDYAKQRVRAGT